VVSGPEDPPALVVGMGELLLFSVGVLERLERFVAWSVVDDAGVLAVKLDAGLVG
jgi:hypothetical protein